MMVSAIAMQSCSVLSLVDSSIPVVLGVLGASVVEITGGKK